MATGIRRATRRGASGRPALDVDNGEELMHVHPGVSLVLGNRSPESPGTLYISTKQAVWFSETDRDKGYAVDFTSVSLHAVSRDPEAYPSPCIYAQIETGVEDDEMEHSDSEDDALDLSKITKMRLVPSDPNHLNTLFAIFCECAELNPDPMEALEEQHNWIFSANQLEDEDAEYEDSDWTVSENPTHSIDAHSIGANGSHDLIHSVVQHFRHQSTAFMTFLRPSLTHISILVQNLH